MALAALARDAGLAEDALTVAQGGGLRAGDVGEPSQVVVGNLAERHAARAALLLDALRIRGFGHVGGRDLRRRDHRAALVVGAVGHSSASSLPRARRGVALDPRGPDAALDLSSSVAELRLEERLAEAFADDHIDGRLPRHRPTLHRGYHVGTTLRRGYRFGYQTSLIRHHEAVSATPKTPENRRLGVPAVRCHGEGRGFESLHPLNVVSQDIGDRCRET
jgi:hypothetical protein